MKIYNFKIQFGNLYKYLKYKDLIFYLYIKK